MSAPTSALRGCAVCGSGDHGTDACCEDAWESSSGGSDAAAADTALNTADSPMVTVAGNVQISLTEVSKEICSTTAELMDADQEDMVRRQLRGSQSRSADAAQHNTRHRALTAAGAASGARPNLPTTMGVARSMNPHLGTLANAIRNKKHGAVAKALLWCR